MSQFNKTTSDEVEPTAKRPRVEDSLTDKATIANQSLAWKNLETFICDQVKIVDQSNIRQIFRNLLQVNLIRGRGLLANAIIEAQKNSPKYTNVYAAFVYIINSKFPRIGKLICGRVISLYRESFVANERKNTFILIKFLAHLINQKVLHEKIAFEIVDVLLRNVSSDSVILAVQFLTECSQKLSRENKKELDSRFSKLSDLLNGPLITQHTKNMIIVLLTERRNRFQVHSTSQSTLNLVNENDKNVHRLECLHLCDREIVLGK
ncbi:unnamed protein product, partial [Rotaria sordida]